MEMTIVVFLENDSDSILGDIKEGDPDWSEPMYNVGYKRTGRVKDDSMVCIFDYWSGGLVSPQMECGEISLALDMPNKFGMYI